MQSSGENLSISFILRRCSRSTYLFLKDRAFDRQAFLRRFQKTVSEDASQQLFFATPEDIILNKLEWYKTAGGVSDRQWNDVLGVLKVQGAQLDMAYLRRWAKELSISNLLKKVLEEAGNFSI